MGYTAFTVSKTESILLYLHPNKVLDLGAQNMYNQPNLPAPYAKDWYESKGIEYTAIDISGENGALPINLSYPIKEDLGTFPFLVDAGTIEHLEIDSKFNWEAIYNGWLNKHNLTAIDGIIYSENPKTGSWPSHGYNYLTLEFYYELGKLAGYDLLEVGEHPACGNDVDGWNVYSIMRKTSEGFPSLEQFKKLSIKES